MVLVNYTKFIPFFQRELPRRSVCHSFAYLLSNSLSALSLGSSRLQKKTTLYVLGFLASWHLEIFGQAGELVEYEREEMRRSQDFFLSLVSLGYHQQKAVLSPQSALPSVLPGPWAAPHYGLTLTKWPCLLDPRNIVFQPQGCGFPAVANL